MFDAAPPIAETKPFPAGVRLPGPDDRQRLIQFLVETHAADGQHFGDLCLSSVELMVDRAISRDRVFLAIIDGPERIEAAIGWVPAKPWWGGDDSWYWGELLVEVLPECRRSRHFHKLKQVAFWFAERAGAPVVINVQPGSWLSRKMHAFARAFRLIGGIFLVETGRG